MVEKEMNIIEVLKNLKRNKIDLKKQISKDPKLELKLIYNHGNLIGLDTSHESSYSGSDLDSNGDVLDGRLHTQK